MLVGGNGAGKSTFHRLYLQPLGLPFVNADLLAKIAYPDAPEEHSYDAAKLAEAQRQQLLLKGVGFPRFRGQVSGVHRGESTSSNELLLVVDRTEVIDR
jgi:predicted ABC-type ATPase